MQYVLPAPPVPMLPFTQQTHVNMSQIESAPLTNEHPPAHCPGFRLSITSADI